VTAEDKLDQLLADYKSYGLPLPPPGSELAILPSPELSSRNGVRHQDMFLVLLVQKSAPPKRAIYWVGCDEGWQWRGIEFKPVPAVLDSMKETAPIPNDYQEMMFPTYPDLALAIQCQAMGWKELAGALFERSRNRPERDSFKRPKPRPSDDRAALAELAWNHYCNRFAAADRAERTVIVTHMKKLTTTLYHLNTQAHLNLVADMAQTAIEVKTEPNSLESAIEGLLDFRDSWGSFLGSGWGDLRNNADRYEPYAHLQKAGFAAVPVLQKHIGDFRITRRIQATQTGSYAWNLRVADLVAQLLNGIANEPFTYDFLEKDGRGVQLDQRHVEKWWTEASSSKELNFLVNALEKANDQDRSSDNAAALHALGSKYPAELVKLFEKRQKENKLDHRWFEALQESKASAKDKERLLLVAARSDDEWQQVFALRSLELFNQAQTAQLVIAALERQPKTPKIPYWQANLSNFAQIAYGLDDDAVWQTLLKTAKRVDLGQRMQMMETFSRQTPDRLRNRAISFLKEFLKDTEGRKGKQFGGLFEGPSAGFMYDNIRVCDLAAEQLANLLDLKDRPEPTWKESDWDKLRTRVEDELVKRSKEKAPKKDR
jgi:hypothetical protein